MVTKIFKPSGDHIYFSAASSPHLDLIPGLHLTAVLFIDALILSSDLIQDLVQVFLRLGVHLHIHRADRNLSTQGCELLKP